MRGAARILVVDDEAIVCRSFYRVLAADGHDVSVSSGGREAILKIASGDFDIVLLDLRLPGMGGLHLLRNFRKASPRTEVIVITGYPTIENAKESIRLGAFDYATKPLAPQTLRAVVSHALACRPWAIHERC